MRSRKIQHNKQASDTSVINIVRDPELNLNFVPLVFDNLGPIYVDKNWLDSVKIEPHKMLDLENDFNGMDQILFYDFPSFLEHSRAK